MRNIIIAMALLAFALSGASTARANTKCNGANPSNNACAAFWFQAGKDAAAGDKVTAKPRKVQKRVQQAVVTKSRKTSKPQGGKSCAIFEQASTGPLVAYAGYYKDRDNARVIGSISPKWKKVGRNKYRAVGCFSKAAMQGESVVTVCGEVGHYEFDGAEVVQFRQQSGPLGSDDVARMRNGG